ncbi:MAG: hypothetical protein CMK44_03325 [Porticoccus sp.]|jgi:hypothetical protein|nr:hypothetical protein [Porticoccus sp.]
MTTSIPNLKINNVIDIFSRQPYSHSNEEIITRLAPEYDGLEMIYSNENNSSKLFSIKIICWGLQSDGKVVGLVPWLDKIVPCAQIQDPLNGRWEGYFDPTVSEVFYEAPVHKVIELETAYEQYGSRGITEDIIQEIPDIIGTHAVISNDGFKNITLKEVICWRLLSSGLIECMLIDDTKVTSTPVLIGDKCLYSGSTEMGFKYYFQHHIANKIKSKDPEALEAIALLVDS